jgi:hypothetical protein
MSNEKISTLPLATALTGNEYVPLVQNGTTCRAYTSTISALNPYISSATINASGQLVLNNSNGTSLNPVTLPGGYAAINLSNISSGLGRINLDFGPSGTGIGHVMAFGGNSSPNTFVKGLQIGGGSLTEGTDGKTPGLVPGCKISPKVLNVAAAEAGGKEDLPWILATINNRAKAWGMTPDDIVTQRKQFEAYGNGSWKNVSPKRLSYLMSDPAVQAACNGVFPEGSEGVMNFYAPTAQKLLYGNLPKWDNGTGKDIGQSRFFKDPNYKDPPVPASTECRQSIPGCAGRQSGCRRSITGANSVHQ